MMSRTEIHNLIAERHVNHFEVNLFHSDLLFRVLSIPSGAGFLLLPRSLTRAEEGKRKFVGSVRVGYIILIYVQFFKVRHTNSEKF